MRRLSETLLRAFGSDRVLGPLRCGAALSHLLNDVRVPYRGSHVELQLRLGASEAPIVVPALPRPVDMVWADLPQLPFATLVRRLGPRTLLQAVTWLLAERRVILVSEHTTLITVAAETLMSLLYPFRYYHTYIPLLPESLLDCLDAPTPYLMVIYILIAVGGI